MAPDVDRVGRNWADHLGSRVVLRVPAGGGRTRDVLGELVAVTGGTLRVRTRSGEEDVAAGAVIAGHPVPPPAVRKAPPHRALSTLGLEAVAARHWVAAESERRAGWLFRAAAGFTNRANSMLPLGEPPAPAGEAVALVASWYGDRGLRPTAALPEPRPDDPDADVLTGAAGAFTAAGWAPIPGAGADVLVAPTGELRGGDGPPPGFEVRLLAEPDDPWLERYHYRGRPLPPGGRALLMSAPEQAFVAIRAGGGTVAVGRGSLAGGWAGIAAVEVHPDCRGQGLAGVVLAELARWAWSRGARSTFVQVGETNDPARNLYLRSGFELHHRYAYVSLPAEPGSPGFPPHGSRRR